MKQKAAEIRGNADAEVIQLTAEAYGRNPEFFIFLKKLEVYKAAMKADTNLILSTDSDLLSLLKSIEGPIKATPTAETPAESTEE
jgi:membrane protease subunit HflC